MGSISTSQVESFGSSRFINRELSWLDFALRVLDLAEDKSVPLLERAKFLAILSDGLDEFFQVRVAGLKDQLAAGVRSLSPDGLSVREQLQAVRGKVLLIAERINQIYNENLLPALSDAGIMLLNWDDLPFEDREYLVGVFENTVFPVLTPLAVDPSHPFPYISNLSLNLLVRVTDPVSEVSRYARVKVPAILPRFVALPDGVRFVPLEQLISANVRQLFPEMAIGAQHVFRVSRNADLTLEEEEADDLLAFVEMELRRRRFGRAVRLEFQGVPDPDVVALLVKELRLHPDDVYILDTPLDLSGLWSVYKIMRADLHDLDWVPVTPLSFGDAESGSVDVFATLREGDVLVHHPYESFSATVERFIEQAANDPAVLAIKQTLYRTSGDSRIVASLIQAAESGKQVAVLVEVKARFDEQANIGWARALEEAGVHVVYGLAGLKTHLKAVLVVRSEDDGSTLRYCHLGTGNYNSKTAKSYEDIGLLTCNPDFGADLSEVFNLLTGFSKRLEYRKLILAPGLLRTRILQFISEQVRLGDAGRIIIKVNGLIDPEVIDALYSASNAGVKVELLVRSICCLRPGVPGLSENIRVKSIVGRFLEHSRIFIFGDPNSNSAKVLVGSADLMQRNLDRRIEALFPIEDPHLRKRVVEIVSLDLDDDSSSWELSENGEWAKPSGPGLLRAQDKFQELAIERATPIRRHVRRLWFKMGVGK
ncbi:MAG: polyphosphate kinase 1 [Actinomycetota bacterium]|nr:MAG: polyphosphate kinase 1 [Actinomycetota bacterium]